MLTPTKKKYLLSIYELEQKKAVVRSVDVARAIHVSKATVSCMLSALADDGLIEKDTYGILELTDKGEKIAEVLSEAYRFIYLFFVKSLKSSHESAKEDAIACVCSLTDENIGNFKDFFAVKAVR